MCSFVYESVESTKRHSCTSRGARAWRLPFSCPRASTAERCARAPSCAPPRSTRRSAAARRWIGGLVELVSTSAPWPRDKSGATIKPARAVNLAFTADADGPWTVVDFKTDLGIAQNRPAYEEQVRLYARAIAQSTSRPTRAVLLYV